MADKRMFSLKILDSDAFLDMPMSARLLYYDLSMRGDDDGFINNPKKIQKNITGASDDDMKLLIAKGFIIPFESGIIVIKHWRMHNYIRKDRYKPTAYQDEMKQLEIKENEVYTHRNCIGIPNDNQLGAQISLDKSSLNISTEPNVPCSQSDSNSSPKPVASLILKNGCKHFIYQSDIDGLKELYKSVDINHELNMMGVWLENNAHKRKTQNGINRFIHTWLGKQYKENQEKLKQSGGKENGHKLPRYGSTV